MRLIGERIDEAWTAAQLRPDLPRPVDTAVARALLLTCIGQAAAMPARKQAAVGVQLGDPSAAIHAVCRVDRSLVAVPVRAASFAVLVIHSSRCVSASGKAS